VQVTEPVGPQGVGHALTMRATAGADKGHHG
jgi:hypothetical protein